MNEPSEIKYPNSLIREENEKKYNLRFDEETERIFRDFCEIFSIGLNKFIVNTITSFLYDIEDDIGSKAFDLIGGYFNVSKLVGVQSCNNTSEVSKKGKEIEVKFPFLISKAIDAICEEILLTPEEFIENSIDLTIVSIIGHIQEKRYNFLNIYKDFSKILELIDQIYKTKLS